MSIVYSIVLLLVSVAGLLRMFAIQGKANEHERAREREMVERVLAALDAVKDQDPAFVAEARGLHGFLVTNAWVVHVGRMSAKANLTADSKIAIARAIFPKPEPAGASA